MPFKREEADPFNYPCICQSGIAFEGTGEGVDCIGKRSKFCKGQPAVIAGIGTAWFNLQYPVKQMYCFIMPPKLSERQALLEKYFSVIRTECK